MDEKYYFNGICLLWCWVLCWGSEGSPVDTNGRRLSLIAVVVFHRGASNIGARYGVEYGVETQSIFNLTLAVLVG